MNVKFDMTDKIIVVLSIISLIIFCLVLLYFVAEPDLIIVVVICLFLAIYDFGISVFKPQSPNEKD